MLLHHVNYCSTYLQSLSTESDLMRPIAASDVFVFEQHLASDTFLRVGLVVNLFEQTERDRQYLEVVRARGREDKSI